MREINVSQITDVVERLCIEANTHLPKDVKDAIMIFNMQLDVREIAERK